MMTRWTVAGLGAVIFLAMAGAAAPDATRWTLLIIGFAAVGSSLRRPRGTRAPAA